MNKLVGIAVAALLVSACGGSAGSGSNGTASAAGGATVASSGSAGSSDSKSATSGSGGSASGSAGVSGSASTSGSSRTSGNSSASAAPTGAGSSAGSGSSGTISTSTSSGSSGSAPDPELVITRVDDSSECDGLVPAPPAGHIDDNFPVGANQICMDGTSDGTGHLVLGYRDHDAPFDDYYVAETSSGQHLNTFYAPYLEPLIPQPSGYQALTSTGSRSGTEFKAIGSDGTTLSTQTVRNISSVPMLDAQLVPDPGGGSMLLWTESQESGAWNLRAMRYDASSNANGYVNVATGSAYSSVSGGVSQFGSALVIYGRDGQDYAVWLAPGQAPQSFDVSGLGIVFYVRGALLDGSVAVASGDGSTYLLQPGSGALQPAPAWLSGAPTDTLHRIHGSRGYALVPQIGSCVIELVAPTGRVCGTVTVQHPSSCSSYDLNIGLDGTLIVRTQDAPACRCGHRWWPALLH